MTLANNLIAGALPVSLGGCKQLEYLSLEINQIGGKIPTSYGMLHQLKWFSVYNNKLIGQVPIELLRLHSLTHGKVCSFQHLFLVCLHPVCPHLIDPISYFFFFFFFFCIKTKRAQYFFNKICWKVLDLYLRVNELKVINIIKIVLQLMYVVMNCERAGGRGGITKITLE